jgi:hypothetical protein
MTIAQYILDHHLNAMRIAGRKVGADRTWRPRHPLSPTPTPALCIGTVPKATLDEVRGAFAHGPCLSATD